MDLKEFQSCFAGYIFKILSFITNARNISPIWLLFTTARITHQSAFLKYHLFEATYCGRANACAILHLTCPQKRTKRSVFSFSKHVINIDNV